MSEKGTIQDLMVWKKARELNKKLFELSDAKEIASDHDIKGKLRSLSLSILTNATKGYEKRMNKNEFARYLDYTRTACFGLQAFLYLLEDLKRISQEQLEKLQEDTLSIIKMSSGLKKSLTAPKKEVATKEAATA